MVQHQMLVVIVPQKLLQLVMEKQQKLLQLVMEKQQKLLQPLRHLRLQLLQLVRHREVTILISSTPSWRSTTASGLQLEFRRSCGATRSPPAHRLGPNIWRRSMKWSTRRASRMARTLLGGDMGVVWSHSCRHSTIIRGYVLGIH